MSRAQRVGRRGEALAARYLEQQGYRILARNARTPYGELDLVALQGDEVVFVEVKARTTLAFGWPEEAITPAKAQRLAQAALTWLAEHPEHGPAWRVDVIAVLFFADAQPPEVRHYRDILAL